MPCIYPPFTPPPFFFVVFSHTPQSVRSYTVAHISAWTGASGLQEAPCAGQAPGFSAAQAGPLGTAASSFRWKSYLAAGRVSPSTVTPFPTGRTQRDASRRVAYLADPCTWSPSEEPPPLRSSPHTKQACRVNREGRKQESPILRGRGAGPSEDSGPGENKGATPVSTSTLRNAAGTVHHSHTRERRAQAMAWNRYVCLRPSQTLSRLLLWRPPLRRQDRLVHTTPPPPAKPQMPKALTVRRGNSFKSYDF